MEELCYILIIISVIVGVAGLISLGFCLALI